MNLKEAQFTVDLGEGQKAYVQQGSFPYISLQEVRNGRIIEARDYCLGHWSTVGIYQRTKGQRAFAYVAGNEEAVRAICVVCTPPEAVEV